MPTGAILSHEQQDSEGPVSPIRVGLGSGQQLPIWDKIVQLPDDAYIGTVEPIPPEIFPSITKIPLPIVVIRRDPYVVAVSLTSGEMYFPGAATQDRAEAIQAFDFMIQVLGADKILPAEETIQ